MNTGFDRQIGVAVIGIVNHERPMHNDFVADMRPVTDEERLGAIAPQEAIVDGLDATPAVEEPGQRGIERGSGACEASVSTLPSFTPHRRPVIVRAGVLTRARR